MFELTALYPLFPGKDEADQIHRIHSVLGTPNASTVERLRKHAWPEASFTFPPQDGISLSKLLPGVSETYMDLLTRSVAYNAPERITAEVALKHHPYFVGDGTTPSATVEGTARSRRAKVTGVAPKPAKDAESKKTTKPVKDEANPPPTKPRSMVSILLARVRPIFCIDIYIFFMLLFLQTHLAHFFTCLLIFKSKPNDVVQETRGKNDTLNRKGGDSNRDRLPQVERTAKRASPSKAKALPTAENKGGDKSPKSPYYKKQARFSHIQSSGYGSPTVPNAGTHNLPSSHNHDRIGHGHAGIVSKLTKLPPLR